MNDCVHEFIDFGFFNEPDFKRIVCAYCGHVREISKDGEIVVKQQIGNVKHEQPKQNSNDGS